ncbi:MAG: SAF domain-containing protein [Nocardioidaceae bacterium]
MPSTRERRPALAALALLLIVGGALASGWLALQAGNRAEFLRVGQEVAQGQQISAGDLETVELPEGFDGAIPAGERSSVEGQYATTRLLARTVLTSDMVDEESGVDDNTVQLPIPTDASTYANLSSGASVAVYLTGGDSGAEAVAGRVVRKLQGEGGSGIGGGPGEATVSVSVDITCGDLVAAAKSENKVELGLVGQVDQTDVQESCGS